MFNDVIKCDKERLQFSINFFLDFTAQTRSCNLQNIYVKELTKWFVFEALQ